MILDRFSILLTIIMAGLITSSLDAQTVFMDYATLAQEVDSLSSLLDRMSSVENAMNPTTVDRLNAVTKPLTKGEFETTDEFQQRVKTQSSSVRGILSEAYLKRRANLDALRQVLRTSDLLSKEIETYVYQVPKYDADRQVLNLDIKANFPPVSQPGVGGKIIHRTINLDRSQAEALSVYLKSHTADGCKARLRYTFDSTDNPVIVIDTFFIQSPSSNASYYLNGATIHIPQKNQLWLVKSKTLSRNVVSVAISKNGDVLAIASEAAGNNRDITLWDSKNNKDLAILPAQQTTPVLVSVVAHSVVLAGDFYRAGTGLMWYWELNKTFTIPVLGLGEQPYALSPNGLKFCYLKPGVAGNIGVANAGIIAVDYVSGKVKEILNPSDAPDPRRLYFLPDGQNLAIVGSGGSTTIISLDDGTTLNNSYPSPPFVTFDKTLARDNATMRWFTMSARIAARCLEYKGPFEGLRIDISGIYDGQSGNLLNREGSVDFGKVELMGLSPNENALAFAKENQVYLYRTRDWTRLSRFYNRKFQYQSPEPISKEAMGWHGYASVPGYAYDMDDNGLPEIYFAESSKSYAVYEHDTGTRLLAFPMEYPNATTAFFRESPRTRTARVTESTKDEFVVVRGKITPVSSFTACHFLYSDTADHKILLSALPVEKGTVAIAVDFEKDGRDEYVVNLDPSKLYTGKMEGRNVKVMSWERNALRDDTKAYAKYIGK